MKLLVLFIFAYITSAYSQQTIDKLNSNQLKLPKESVSKALILDATGQVKSSSTITDTELSYLDGLTNTITSLLSGKADDSVVVKLTPNQSVNGTKTFIGKLVASTTSNASIPCPVMTETQRNVFTAAQGDCVFNSTSLQLNIYDGTIWKAAGGSGGISLWITSTSYAVDNVVIQSDKIYRCLVAHTSGTFATDLGAGRWTEVSASPATPYSLANGGTNKALTASNGGVVWVDTDSFEILAPGTSGQILQSNAAAAPSWVNKSISAKSDNAASVTLEEIQVSNNQLTQTATNKHRIEAGNSNILANPSFEHSTFSTGWTNSTGTFAEETVIDIDGLKSAKVTLTAQALTLTQDSTLYQAQFADGVQGLAMVRVKTSVSGIRVCSRQNAVVTSNLCVNVQANGKWGLYKVPFTLGGTSNGISINSNGTSVTGDVYVDDAFVGAVDLSATVDQSRMAGESYFAGTTGCNWARTSTTIGAFTAVAACPGPTVSYSSMGQWQTTDSDLPRQIINNLPSGVYKASFTFLPYSSVISNPAYTITDGTTTCAANGPNGLTTGDSATISCTFTYTSSGNRTFEIYASSDTGAALISNISATGYSRNSRFQLEYFGSGSVYSSTNADTDWTSCTPTSSQGFGTPTFAVQCKREGGDLLMKGRFTPSGTTAVEARLGLPLWNGVQLVSAGSSVIPNLEVANGFYVRGVSASAHGGAILIEPSVSYLTFGAADTFNATASVGLAKANGNAIASTEILSFNARIPIESWQNSNIIIGQFNGLESCTNTLQCTDTFSALISATGTVVAGSENVDWLNGNCTLTNTSTYTCSYNTGIFTVTPNCTISHANSTSGVIIYSSMIDSFSSATSLIANLYTSGARATSSFQIICQKQGADYIGKTAKAVASDQNLRTSGVTKGVVYSATTTGTTVTATTGNWISSISNPATGNYVISFAANTFASTPICTITGYKTGTETNSYHCNYDLAGTNNASTMSLRCNQIGGAGAYAVFNTTQNIVCHGVSP